MLQQIISILYIAIFWNIICTIFAKPTTLENDPNIPFLETFINSVSEDNFKKDIVLIHSMTNGYSSFRNLPTRKNGSLVFQLKPIPSDKNIVIISGYNDNIRRSKKDETEQRTYVTLRKKSSTKDQYFINYVYVRNLFTRENKEGSVIIAGKPKRFEFDIWDYRGASNNYDNLFGWSTCSRTFFASCTGDPNSSSRLNDKIEPDYENDEVVDDTNNDKGDNTEPISPTAQESEDPSSESSTVKLSYDFFTDLDDEIEHAWFVGASIIFVTNTKLRISTTVEAGEIEDMQPERKKRQGYGGGGNMIVNYGNSAGAVVDANYGNTGYNYGNTGGMVVKGNLPGLIVNQNPNLKYVNTGNQIVKVNSGASGNIILKEYGGPSGNVIMKGNSGTSGNIILKGGTGTSGSIVTSRKKGTGAISGGGVIVNGNSGVVKVRTKPRITAGSTAVVGAGAGAGASTTALTANQITAAQMQECYEYVRKNNIGGQGGNPFDKSMYSVDQAMKDVHGYEGTDGRLSDGSDKRGLQGDKDNPGTGGILHGVDGLAHQIGNLFGYGPNQASNSPGMKLANAVRDGGGLGYGISEGLADTVGTMLGVGTVSDDRSDLDGIMDEALPGIFTGVFGGALDIVNIIAKPLGLEGLIGDIGGLAGALWGGTLGGPAAAVVGPVKLALDFGKLAFKALGLGGIFGMKGSSNKGLQTYCMNLIMQLDTAMKVQNRKKGIKVKAAGRTFGSTAAKMGGTAAEFNNVDIYSPLGWRGLLTLRKHPFVGIGSCYLENKNFTLDKFKEIRTSDELAEFYLKTLRTDCNPKQLVQLTDLVKDNHLIMNADQTFSLNPKSTLTKKQKLSTKELNSLSLAFEMSIYSEIFAKEMEVPTQNPMTPEGKKCSLSVVTLNRMALTVLSQAVENSNPHVIKLIRNQIITLKSAFIKLLQDSQILTLCRRCRIAERLELDKDIEMVFATLFYLIHKFEPLPGNSLDNEFTYEKLKSEFKKFYIANIKDFKKEIVLYTTFPTTGMFG